MPDEETIFQALMLWVGHDVQARQQDLAMLLSYIRLPLLPPQVWELTQVMEVIVLNDSWILIYSLFVLYGEFLAQDLFHRRTNTDFS